MGSGKEDMMVSLMLLLYCSDVDQKQFSDTEGILQYHQ